MAWLIESSQEKSQVGGPLYLTVQGTKEHNPKVLGKLIWSPQWDQALHFGREDDCYLFLQAMTALMNKLPYESTVRGLREDDPYPFVREHLTFNGVHKP